MRIVKYIFIGCFVLLLLVNCSKENNFLIEKGQVGLINNETIVDDLKTLFYKDSLVSNLSSNPENENKLFSNKNDEYLVFSKTGKKLLEIVPVVENDSTSKIKSIQIFDADYKTIKGLSLLSSFKDVNQNYIVDNIETTLTSATLFIDELNATIAIDKKELGLNPFSREQVTLDQIPDIAKIKYFTIWFN